MCPALTTSILRWKVANAATKTQDFDKAAKLGDPNKINAIKLKENSYTDWLPDLDHLLRCLY